MILRRLSLELNDTRVLVLKFWVPVGLLFYVISLLPSKVGHWWTILWCARCFVEGLVRTCTPVVLLSRSLVLYCWFSGFSCLWKLPDDQRINFPFSSSSGPSSFCVLESLGELYRYQCLRCNNQEVVYLEFRRRFRRAFFLMQPRRLWVIKERTRRFAFA